MPPGSWWPGRRGSRYLAGAKLLGRGMCESGCGSCAHGGLQRRHNARSPGLDRAAWKTGPHSHRDLGSGAQPRIPAGRGLGQGVGPWDPGVSSYAGSSSPLCHAPRSGKRGPRGRCGQCAACRERRSAGRDTSHQRPAHHGRFHVACPVSPLPEGSEWTRRTRHCSGGSCTGSELGTEGRGQ